MTSSAIVPGDTGGAGVTSSALLPADTGGGVYGGPLGRYADRRSRLATPVRLLLIIASVTLLLGYAEKAPCASGLWGHSLQYTHVCYSDVIPLWNAEGLADGAVPYRDHAVEYPVLTGGFMWLTAELTRGWHAMAADGLVPGTDQTVVFGVFTCALLALCGLLTVVSTAGAAGTARQWDVAILAASPLLVFHAFSNWDLFAMAFTSAALWAWARHRPVASGVLLGLGTAAKLYPALLLLPLLLLGYRSSRLRPVLWAAAAAAGSWLAVNLPVALNWSRGWAEFYSFSASRPAEASTGWAMLKHYFPGSFGGASSVAWTPPALAVAALLLLALAGVSWLALAAPVRPRLAQLAFLTVAAFLLSTKVWSPQYSIWLVPLVALALPRWRAVLVWQATEIVVWVVTLLWLLSTVDGGNSKAPSYENLTSLLLLRDLAVLGLMALVVMEMWHPELDRVRSPQCPDPGAGVFASSRVDRRWAAGFGPVDVEPADIADPAVAERGILDAESAEGGLD